jgi:hypothetical protein
VTGIGRPAPAVHATAGPHAHRDLDCRSLPPLRAMIFATLRIISVPTITVLCVAPAISPRTFRRASSLIAPHSRHPC